jgi:PAS domain S-box-containing protein
MEECAYAESSADQRRFRAIIEHATDLVAIVDAAGIVLYTSPSVHRLLGYAPEVVHGTDIRGYAHPDDVGGLLAAIEQSAASGAPVSAVLTRVRHAAGGWRSLELVIQVRLADEAIRGVVINGRDVTDHLRAEAALRESESHFRTLIEYSPIGACITDGQGRFESMNSAFADLLGYRPDELIGRPLALMVPEDSRARFEARLAQRLQTNRTDQIEVEVARKDGTRLTVLATGVSIRDHNGRVHRASYLSDITARVKAERAVEEARRTAEALDQVSLALATTLEPAALYRIILEQAATVLPFEHAGILAYRDGWAEAVAWLGEPAVTPGTRLFPVSGPGRLWLVEDQGTVGYLSDTDAEPTWVHVDPWLGEQRIRSVVHVPLCLDGETMGAFQVHSISCHRYEERHLRLAQAFGARIEQALRNARLYATEQERARAAEELARLRDDFVTSVSHELRTPLTAIVGYSELLQAQWGQMTEAHRRAQVDRIVLAANRQRRLVEDLLLLSQLEGGQSPVHLRPLRLAPLLDRAVRELEGSYAGQQIDLAGPAALRAVADPDRVLQIVINLLDNAAKYSPEGAPIAISWGQEDGIATIRVRDRGPGLAAGGREILFSRFGRMAGSPIRAGRVGTGLGLYLGRQLARAMEGDLDLEATGPEGSIFRLRLPACSMDHTDEPPP